MKNVTSGFVWIIVVLQKSTATGKNRRKYIHAFKYQTGTVLRFEDLHVTCLGVKNANA